MTLHEARHDVTGPFIGGRAGDRFGGHRIYRATKRGNAAERISHALRPPSLPAHADVHPPAFTAGALLAIPAKENYTRPGAVIGPATPVDV